MLQLIAVVIIINLNDYIEKYSRISFWERPFGEIDALVCANLAYIHWDDVVSDKPVKLSEACKMTINREKDPDRLKTLNLLISSKRYQHFSLYNYVSETDYQQQKQFSAITIKISPFKRYIAYRGTDSTVNGWKEDFNMSFMCPVPAQERAWEYLTDTIEKRHIYYVGGHSKGGNLAVYAAVMNGNERIKKVYNFDGPGFSDEFVASEKYTNFVSKIASYIPQGSIVGLLMSNNVDHKIIHSNSDDFIWQHDPYTWQIEYGHFVNEDGLTQTARIVNSSVNSWYNDLTIDERITFINTIYDIINAQGIHTLYEIADNRWNLAKEAAKSFSKYDGDTRNVLISASFSLIADIVKSFWTIKFGKESNDENTGSK